jgi:N-glycosylase/DNA lyase
LLESGRWCRTCAHTFLVRNVAEKAEDLMLTGAFAEPLLTYTYPAPPKELSGGDDDFQIAPTTITYYPFPSVARLAEPDIEDRLRELSFGYRARYIQETAKLLMDKLTPEEGRPKYESPHDYLNSLRSMTYEEARRKLLQFQGVGPKVAE